MGLFLQGIKVFWEYKAPGAFFIRKGLELKPLKYGGTGRNSQQLTYEDGDYEYEVGTQNLPGIRHFLPVWNSCWKPAWTGYRKKKKG